MTTRFSKTTRAEFDLVARWTTSVVDDLGPDYYIPGACRGSGNPAHLTWLAESLGLRPELRFADIGGGMGGPAAWASQHYGVRPILIEAMPGATQAARKLFGHTVINADAEQLALGDKTFDAVWLLAVLDTTDHPAAVLREAHRILRPGGHLGLLEYVNTGNGSLDAAPTSNTFNTLTSLLELLASAGFLRVAECAFTELSDPPVPWQFRVGCVDDLLAERHGPDPRWHAVRHQEQQFADLLNAGAVAPIGMHAIALDDHAEADSATPAIAEGQIL